MQTDWPLFSANEKNCVKLENRTVFAPRRSKDFKFEPQTSKKRYVSSIPCSPASFYMLTCYLCSRELVHVMVITMESNPNIITVWMEVCDSFEPCSENEYTHGMSHVFQSERFVEIQRPPSAESRQRARAADTV